MNNNTTKPMKIFTASGINVEVGARVARYTLQGAGVTIPAIIVGESGRGRRLGIVTVEGVPLPTGDSPQSLYAATVGKTRAGKPKLIAAASEDEHDDSAAIVVLRTPIGGRGWNSHTGDKLDDDQLPPDASGDDKFAPFPGQILAEGVIAQGAAGYAGSGQQLITIVPRDVVFRASIRGRRAIGTVYYAFDGEQVLAVKAADRPYLPDGHPLAMTGEGEEE